MPAATAWSTASWLSRKTDTDPDGHVLEFGYMDPVAAEQGPEAFMSQQA